MSKKHFEVSAEEAAANKAFLEARAATPGVKRIQRKSLQARLTHGAVAISCILLSLTGLFVFVPSLGAMVGSDAVFACRMMHRVLGAIFIFVPIISALLAPKGVKHILKNLFAPWNSDDVKWMILFMPYLFLGKHLHMPDQDETKSGQRFADGIVWLACLTMAVSGAAMIIGAKCGMAASTYGVWLTVHDIGFFFIALFGLAHIFIGAGIFTPYRRMHRVMWGDGTISESDALYHWGHWARKVIAEDEICVQKEK